MISINNGLVYLDNQWQKLNLIIKDDHISGVSTMPLKNFLGTTINAEGKYVLPGLMDMHVHLDDKIGSFYLSDNYESGTRQAVKNGVTTVFSFITQRDGSLQKEIAHTLNLTEDSCFTNIGFHITPKNVEDLHEYMNQKDGNRIITVKLYTTYREAGLYCDYQKIETFFREFQGKPVRFLIHCEDDDVLTHSDRENVQVTKASGITRTRPEEAEVTAIEKVLALGEVYQTKIHIVHVSTARGMELITKMRDKVDVTCETCPQYLVYSDDQLAEPEGYRFLCTPPLRSDETRRSLMLKVKQGQCDVIATDHCAFMKEDKDMYLADFRKVPKGVAGIGASPHILLNCFRPDVLEGMTQMVKCMSENPAKIHGLYPERGCLATGSKADLCIVDPVSFKQPIVSSQSDTYETYEGMTTQLSFDYVFVNGKLIVRDNKIINHNPEGMIL